MMIKSFKVLEWVDVLPHADKTVLKALAISELFLLSWCEKLLTAWFQISDCGQQFLTRRILVALFTRRKVIPLPALSPAVSTTAFMMTIIDHLYSNGFPMPTSFFDLKCSSILDSFLSAACEQMTVWI